MQRVRVVGRVFVAGAVAALGSLAVTAGASATMCDSATSRASGPPSELRYASGSYWGGFRVVRWDNEAGQLIVTWSEPGGRAGEVGRVQPNSEEWDCFWRRLETVNAWAWYPVYDGGVADSGEWSLRVTHGVNAFSSYGVAAYPQVDGSLGRDWSTLQWVEAALDVLARGLFTAPIPRTEDPLPPPPNQPDPPSQPLSVRGKITGLKRKLSVRNLTGFNGKIGTVADSPKLTVDLGLGRAVRKPGLHKVVRCEELTVRGDWQRYRPTGGRCRPAFLVAAQVTKLDWSYRLPRKLTRGCYLLMARTTATAQATGQTAQQQMARRFCVR